MASQRAGAPGPGGPHADPHAPASSLDGATAQVTAQDTAVGVDIGAGRLFVRPTPAQLLKGGDGGAGTTRKPQLHLATGVEGEGHHQGGGPPRQPKSGKDALVRVTPNSCLDPLLSAPGLGSSRTARTSPRPLRAASWHAQWTPAGGHP